MAECCERTGCAEDLKDRLPKPGSALSPAARFSTARVAMTSSLESACCAISRGEPGAVRASGAVNCAPIGGKVVVHDYDEGSVEARPDTHMRSAPVHQRGDRRGGLDGTAPLG